MLTVPRRQVTLSRYHNDFALCSSPHELLVRNSKSLRLSMLSKAITWTRGHQNAFLKQRCMASSCGTKCLKSIDSHSYSSVWLSQLGMIHPFRFKRSSFKYISQHCFVIPCVHARGFLASDRSTTSKSWRLFYEKIWVIRLYWFQRKDETRVLQMIENTSGRLKSEVNGVSFPKDQGNPRTQHVYFQGPCVEVQVYLHYN